jgi:RND family efflux transporter MFP subunit
LATPGVPLVQIESAGPLQLQVSVDESAIGNIRKGMKIAVAIDGAPTAVTSGVVAEIVPAADAASHSFQVKIDLSSASQLHSGMYGSAEVATGTHKAILAPRSAIVMRGTLPSVYAIDSSGAAQLRAVTLGNAHGDLVEVLSGLASGEKLVDAPGDRDLAGKRIEVLP